MCLAFERTYDYELVREVFTHPKLWPHLSDDGSPAPEDYYPPEHEAIWYVTVRDISEDGGQELLGLWMLHPENTITWQIHTALLPRAWGARATQAALELPAWIWEHTPCRRIVTNVPENNRLALAFAFGAQMQLYGINERSWLKGGKLWDQICLGLSAPAEVGKGSLVVAAIAPASPGERSDGPEMGTAELMSCGVRLRGA